MKTVINKPGYKHTPLGWIPEDWEVKKIGSLIQSLTSGVSVNGEDYSAGPNEYGVLKVSAVSYGYFNENENKAVLQKELGRVRQNPLVGRIIVSRANTPELVGASAFVFKTNPNLFLSDKLWQLETKENSDSLWLSYILSLKQIRDIIRDRATGSSKSMRNISQAAFYSIEVPLPPLPEQHRIATILSAWDAAIAKEQQLINALQTRHRALMQQLLSGKKRLKGFKGKWKEVKIGELFNEINDINDGQGHPAMTISARHGLISQHEKFDRIIAGDSLKKYTLLQKGDFAYNKGNSKLYEMGCMYQLDKSDTALVPFVYICFRPTALIESLFYKHWFMAHGLDRQLKKIITSGARGDGLLNVNTEDFFKLKIPYPIKEEQTAIANILSTSEKEIQTHRRHLAVLQQQKKGLMQVLLTGKIRVNLKK